MANEPNYSSNPSKDEPKKEKVRVIPLEYISENKREYYIMALMVVANIPLLYFLNKEWYGALMYTTFGKVALAICGAVMLFTFLRMQKYCKPVEYRR